MDALNGFLGVIIGSLTTIISINQQNRFQKRFDEQKWLKEKRASCAEEILRSIHLVDSALLSRFTKGTNIEVSEIPKVDLTNNHVYLQLYFPPDSSKEIRSLIYALGKYLAKDTITRNDLDIVDQHKESLSKHLSKYFQ